MALQFARPFRLLRPKGKGLKAAGLEIGRFLLPFTTAANQ
jgi:hypothetical protein